MRNTALNDLLNQQTQAIQQLHAYITTNNIDELMAQNEQLHHKIDQLIQQNQTLSIKINQQGHKIVQQRASIMGLLLELKARYCRQNSQKLRKMLGGVSSVGYQRFVQSQTNFKQALHELENLIEKLDTESKQELSAQIAHLKQEIQARFKQERENLQVEMQQLESHLITDVTQEMLDQPVTEAVVEQTIAEHQLETNIGLKVFNYIGIGFIFLAMIVLGRLGIGYLSDAVKSSLLFATAVLFFVGGEYFQCKNKQTFAYGLLGGAFGLSYIATFTSYFILHFLSNALTLAFLLGIAVVCFVLTTLHQSQIIGSLALVGGYIPLIAYLLLTTTKPEFAIHIAQLYTLIITTAAVVLSQKFKWQGLNLLAYVLSSPWVYLFGLHYSHHLGINMLYAGYLLALFIGLPLSVKTQKFEPMALISAVGALVNVALISLLSLESVNSFSTLGALIFNVCLYWGLSYLLSYKIEGYFGGLERFSLILGVMYTFIIALIWVPVHFSDSLMHANALMLLATSLLIYGYFNLAQKFKDRWLKVAAYMASGLYALILPLYLLGDKHLIYGGLSFIVMLAVYRLIYRDLYANKWLKMVALSAIYIQFNLLLLQALFALPNYHETLLTGQQAVMITGLLMTFEIGISQRFKMFQATKIPVVHISLLAIVTSLLDNVNCAGMTLVLLNLLNLAVFVNVYHLVMALYRQQKISQFVAIVSFSSYVMINLLCLAYSNLHFEYLNILVDVMLGLLAIGYIFYGFRKFIQALRVTGLVLMLLAMAKLLLVDMSYSSLVMRLIIFIIFGILSLLISYSYQVFVKKYAVSEEDKED